MNKDNIRPSVEISVYKPVQELQFCAHDDKSTTLQYSTRLGWHITNENGLLLDHYGNNLHRAMGDMACITGNSSDTWTIITTTWA